MPIYIKATLHKYQHPAPILPEHAPHQWNTPVYSDTAQYVEDTQDIPVLSPTYVTHLQQLGGKLIYYPRALDPLLILPVYVLASEQITQLLYYAPKIHLTLPCIIHDIYSIWNLF
jgi:hypothetical protein